MTSRERLLASLRGQAVDRPAVNFYEIGGFRVDPDDPDRFNIYNDASWRPLLQLAEEQTDLIRMRAPLARFRYPELRAGVVQEERDAGEASWQTRLRITAGGRELQQVQRRDAAVDTVWTIEHLLKSEEDVRAFLQLPDEVLARDVDCGEILAEERALGERGLVMIDTPDPLCQACAMMSTEDYTVLALTNEPLFHALLEKLSAPLYEVTRAAARACPGYLWRIFGPEYATPPYLPPRLFEQYVVRYTGPMVDAIHESGGYARIHCHGRIREVLPHIVGMGADATDPIEPPPQGNIELIEVRERYGRELTLFGNIEASDIEMLEPAAFERKVAQALREGTAGTGRGFVLMPSACPYGRTISSRTMANYQTMIRLTMRGG